MICRYCNAVGPYILRNYKKKGHSTVILYSNYCSMKPKENVSKLNNTDITNYRENPLKIQMLSRPLFKALFGTPTEASKANIVDSVKHLVEHNLWGKNVPILPDVDFPLPLLKGKSLDEHFRIIAEDQSKLYKTLIDMLVSSNLPKSPQTWNFSSGWTRYNDDGTFIKVSYPECSTLVFDIEICVSEGRSPTMACAVSDKYWYSWCSESLIDPTKETLFTMNNLIPLENSSEKGNPKVVIGHNVGFDRLAVKEQYFISKSPIRFVDTMSLHIAVSGLVGNQRNLIKKNESASNKICLPWMNVGSLNNLKDVYKLYCKKELSKEVRNIFVKGKLSDIVENFQELATYCSKDVIATKEVLSNVLPLFYARFPNPVTFSGMLEMGSTYLPVTENWKKYLESTEEIYNKCIFNLNSELVQEVKKALELLENDRYKEDIWLWDLDWDLPKGRVKYLKNYPNWYRKICKNVGEREGTPEPENMNTGLRIVPKILRLTWKGYPLHHEIEHGWGYLMPASILDPDKVENNPTKFPYESFMKYCSTLCNKDSDSKMSDTRTMKGFDIGIPNVVFYKLPHKDGDTLNVGNPLAKDFMKKLDDGTLSSAVKHIAELVLKMATTVSYWKNNRDRVLNQSVVWLDPEDLPSNVTTSTPRKVKCGTILPLVVTAGTITRRAVESTWMTASNSYENRIGSELKSMIQSPPGYHFVGADVDSQELWIASILGDAYFRQIHGGTAFGWMTLQGNKADGTDMHSRTAETIGISRNNAKVINYGRIYGAGQGFIKTLLQKFNPDITPEKASELATKLIYSTKGERGYQLNGVGLRLAEELEYFSYCESPISKKQVMILINSLKRQGEYYKFTDLVNPDYIWINGTESHMFNCLEAIVKQDTPRTPFLGCRITRTLEPWCAGDDFITSRLNWVVQSSAVDFLHLLLVTMNWLFEEYKINGRFCISIHDEVRYMVASEDRYRAALALHIANLLTRAYFCTRLGMEDLPQSVAFFSGVDIDTVLRKDPFDDCVTPSNPNGLREGYNIPFGECLDIHEVIKRTNGTLEPP